ncbi:hypothetical protein C8J57DRAFT_1234933 [Mycena rebaudengoi]|nr:hypothetical protein C8J57DRAFT_1234933 [Mycena rebaudengoi]
MQADVPQSFTANFMTKNVQLFSDTAWVDLDDLQAWLCRRGDLDHLLDPTISERNFPPVGLDPRSLYGMDGTFGESTGHFAFIQCPRSRQFCQGILYCQSINLSLVNVERYELDLHAWDIVNNTQIMQRLNRGSVIQDKAICYVNTVKGMKCTGKDASGGACGGYQVLKQAAKATVAGFSAWRQHSPFFKRVCMKWQTRDYGIIDQQSHQFNLKGAGGMEDKVQHKQQLMPIYDAIHPFEKENSPIFGGCDSILRAAEFQFEYCSGSSRRQKMHQLPEQK